MSEACRLVLLFRAARGMCQIEQMASDAAVALVGVLFGSVTTSAVNIYRERIVSRRDREAREAALERESVRERAVFQRDSILGLQTALADLVKAVYDEQDRMLRVNAAAGSWPIREWATPTAMGWADAEIRIDVLRARVFEPELQTLASSLRTTSRRSVWAATMSVARSEMEQLEALLEEFNARVALVLPDLY